MNIPSIQPGNGELPKLSLAASDGARAEIYLHGAHVTSWTPAGCGEALFLSPKANFHPGAAIRGGVPIIFPQFADLGKVCKHGFARTSDWELSQAAPEYAILRLREDQVSLGLWPQRFELEYTLRIGGRRLELELKVSNRSSGPFDFTAALHSYLRVNDSSQVSIQGLRGLQFSDNTDSRRESTQKDELLTFPGEVDRIYFKAAMPLQLSDAGQKINLAQSGFTDVVTWNPGPEKCAALKDMQPNGYLQFVCIEAAVVEKPVILEPGESWVGMQILTAVSAI